MMSDKQTQDDLNRILHQVSGATATMHTTDEHQAAEQQTQGTIRLIDVHVYDVPAAEQPDLPLESTVSEPTTDPGQPRPPHAPQEDEAPSSPIPARASRTRKKRRPVLLVV